MALFADSGPGPVASGRLLGQRQVAAWGSAHDARVSVRSNSPRAVWGSCSATLWLGHSERLLMLLPHRPHALPCPGPSVLPPSAWSVFGLSAHAHPPRSGRMPAPSGSLWPLGASLSSAGHTSSQAMMGPCCHHVSVSYCCISTA